jgi:hypothetical protein
MSGYTRNRHCPCARCRAHGLMGAALIITVGVLFLLDTNGIIWFNQSWPVLLLVVGAFIFMARSASTENHIEPWSSPVRGNAPISPQQGVWGASVPPPPPPSAPPDQNSEVKL